MSLKWQILFKFIVYSYIPVLMVIPAEVGGMGPPPGPMGPLIEHIGPPTLKYIGVNFNNLNTLYCNFKNGELGK